MSITFTSGELSRIEATVQALLSPSAHPDVDTWRDLVLERLAQLLRADRAMFGIAMPGFDSGYRLLGAEESELEPYLTHYRHVDPNTTVIPEMEDGIVSTTLLVPRAPGGSFRYYRSEVYNEYYKPLGIEDHVAIAVEPRLETCTDSDMLHGASAFLSAYRSRYGTELFGDKGVAIMRLLRPALMGGLEALHILARQRASLEQTVDLMGEGAWLCTAEGELLHENEAMARLLSADAERDRLEAVIRSAVRALSLFSRDSRLRRQEIALPELPTVRTRRAWYRVRGSLLETRSGTLEPGMVIVLQRYDQDALPLELLQERFGLTPRQARVALLLANRRRNHEIAELLSISPNTARRHTDSVLWKLGVHSRDAVQGAILDGLGFSDLRRG